MNVAFSSEKLSEEVLSIAKGQLLVQLRFLDRALYELTPRPCTDCDLATDGRHILYRPMALLHAYRQEPGYAVRVWGHILGHCLFQHMFGCAGMDRKLWDLACDMAAEATLTEMSIRQLEGLSSQGERKQILEDLANQLHPLTAEKLYRFLLDKPSAPAVIAHWKELFELDDHSLWYNDFTLEASVGLKEDISREALTEMWQDISERMQTDLETFSKLQGDRAGWLLQSLRALNRERTDYAAFLRRFATEEEVMRVSPDEFDYNYYTYGLELYGDMPLIEPLEYRDDLKVRELVIAIDTSGSVAGELVQAFLQKTWNIIKQQESFARRFVIHIIQCDAEIQEDAVITTQAEFDCYIKTMTLHGFGGTDFRPVFEYIDHLRRDGQLRKLKGLLYFTDGYGTYPQKMPDYQTAFVFLEKDDFAQPHVPAWAMRVLLDEDQIHMKREGSG